MLLCTRLGSRPKKSWLVADKIQRRLLSSALVLPFAAPPKQVHIARGQTFCSSSCSLARTSRFDPPPPPPTRAVWHPTMKSNYPQRTLAGGGSSNKPTPEAPERGAGRLPRGALRQTPTPTQTKGSARAAVSGSEQKSASSTARIDAETKTSSGEGVAAEEAAASAQRVAKLLRAEDEAEAAVRALVDCVFSYGAGYRVGGCQRDRS